MNDFDLGRQHGYLALESKYPNNPNYAAGHLAGEKRSEKEWRDNQPDNEYVLSHPAGANDAHTDFHYC